MLPELIEWTHGEYELETYEFNVPYEPLYSEETIRMMAYSAWEKAGRPEGMADYFWLESEKSLNLVNSYFFNILNMLK